MEKVIKIQREIKFKVVVSCDCSDCSGLFALINTFMDVDQSMLIISMRKYLIQVAF